MVLSKTYFNIYFVFLLLLAILFISCTKDSTIIKIEQTEVKQSRLIYQLDIQNAYGNEQVDTLQAVLTIIENVLHLKVASANNIIIKKQMLISESDRVDRETKAPRILDKVKTIFKSNHADYLTHYIKPVLVRRFLEQKFFFDTLYHTLPYNGIKLAYSNFNKYSKKLYSILKVFTPKKNFLNYYENSIGKGIVDDKYSYYFVVMSNDNLKVFLTSKNDYTKWFQKQAMQYSVIIYDDDLKKIILRGIKGSKFWTELIKGK